MLAKIKEELDNLNAFNTPLPDFVEQLVKTIPSEKIDKTMKITIAISELITFTSQFRRNILHYNGSLIPINAITFCISNSGAGKDSSINTMRRNFENGYKIITDIRQQIAVDKAIKIATSKNLAKANEPIGYSRFYEEPTPIFVGLSTNEGFIRYLNELDEDGIGSGYIFSGEFAQDLDTSSVIIQNLQLISELYDEGKKEVKALKSKENQSKEIKNLPVSALFLTSPDTILYEEDVKKKFKLQFSSKLARRSFFNFNPKEILSKDYPSVDDMLKDELEQNRLASDIRTKFNAYSKEVADKQLELKGKAIKLSDEARNLVILYKNYNERYSDEIVDNRYPITKLVTRHLYWKALKLSGAFALYKGESEISEESYKQAITFTELLNEDMKNFEIELSKEKYEVFVSYMNLKTENKTTHTLGIHLLKKMGFISGTANLSSKIKDLCHLAGSYDLSGVYRPLEDGIEYSKIIKTNIMGISFLECSGSKEQRAKHSSVGFKYEQIEFSMLRNMLEGDYAYSPFEFKDGIRSKANVKGKIKWIALDVDSSIFTDEETHIYLGNFNHHIARTSDKTNPYKFRVLLELDSYVDLNDITYKKFIASISEFLSLDADILPRSQIYFSYKDREILSVTDKEPIEVREHLINAYEETKEIQDLATLTDKQKRTKLSNPLDTFRYAYEAKQGEGSISLIRAARHAKDLGMSKDEILQLMQNINDYWVYPMPFERLENTILNQIKRW